MTNRQIVINRRTVASLPLFETSILAPVINTYREPTSTNDSLIKIEYKRLSGIYKLSHISKIINTTLSVNGSNIIPNLETKLYFLATIPSKESDKPITAIIMTKEKTLKLLGVKKINKPIAVKNLNSVIKFGKRNISLNFKEDLLHRV